MYADPDRRPSGETPIPPPTEPMGRVVQFPGTPAPQAETPATPDRKARKAPKPRKYRLKNAIKADMTLPLRARIIGADLAELCDISEECAYPSHATLMQRNGMKLDTVKRALHDLDVEGKGAGYFSREVCAGPSGQNRYRPQWAKINLDSGADDASRTPQGECSSALGGSAVVHSGGSAASLPGGSAVVHSIREGKQQNEEKQKGAAHARGAAVPSLVGEGDRPSRGASSREPVLDLPADSIFDPVDTAAAIARGHTAESVAKAEQSFRNLHAGKRKTAAQWREAGRKWIEAERLPQPDPDEMVRVPTGALMPDRRCKRSDVEPWESFVDSKGFRHPARKPSREGRPIV